MSSHVQDQIIQFNRLFKQYDDIYRSAAKKFDMPELTLWILYVLCEKSECTQRDLVDLLLQPKQSIHSALKGMVKDEYVVLECSEHNRKNKYIRLTGKGRSLAENTADQIVRAENSAFLALTGEERQTILDLFKRLTFSLRREVERIE